MTTLTGILCGPPQISKVESATCWECTGTLPAGTDWNDESLHVMRECVTQWQGLFYGIARFFECGHVEEGMQPSIGPEEYAARRATAVIVGDLYDAYVEAEEAAHSPDIETPEQETAVVEAWGAVEQAIQSRYAGAALVR